MYFLDSDYLINFLNGKEETVRKLSVLSKNDLYTSVICVAEVLEGLIDSRKQEEKTKIFIDFLKNIDVLDVDIYVADTYSKIRKELRRKGELIDKFDLLIASTCIANKLILVTGNKKHFERIKGLKIR